MNSVPLSESIPSSLKGRLCSMSCMASRTPIWPLPITALASTQVEKMSVRLSECTNSPFSELPEWETRSVSVKPASGDVPGVGFDGDVVFEQCAGFGASVEAPLELGFPGFESAIDLARRDREQLLFDGQGDGEVFFGPGQPKRQERF